MYGTTEDMVNNLISHIYPKGKVCYKPNAHSCFFSGHQECIQVTVRNKGNTKKGLKYEKEPEHRISVKRKHRATDIVLDICGLPYIMEVLL